MAVPQPESKPQFYILNEQDRAAWTDEQWDRWHRVNAYAWENAVGGYRGESQYSGNIEDLPVEELIVIGNMAMTLVDGHRERPLYNEDPTNWYGHAAQKERALLESLAEKIGA